MARSWFHDGGPSDSSTVGETDDCGNVRSKDPWLFMYSPIVVYENEDWQAGTGFPASPPDPHSVQYPHETSTNSGGSSVVRNGT